MKLSLPLFVAASALLICAVRYCGRALLAHWLPCVLLCSMALCSCSTQVATSNDGTRLVNNNLLAKGGMTKNADGSVVMWGNAEKAAGELGKYGGALISAGLITRGIEAAQSVGNNAVDAIK